MRVEVLISTKLNGNAKTDECPISCVAVVLDAREDAGEPETIASEASPLHRKIVQWLRLLGSVLLALVTIVSAWD